MSRMKGELDPTKTAFEADFLAYGWQGQLLIDYFFLVRPLPETAMGFYVTASWVPYHKHYLVQPFPLGRGKAFHPAQMI